MKHHRIKRRVSSLPWWRQLPLAGSRTAVLPVDVLSEPPVWGLTGILVGSIIGTMITSSKSGGIETGAGVVRSPEALVNLADGEPGVFAEAQREQAEQEAAQYEEEHNQFSHLEEVKRLDDEIKATRSQLQAELEKNRELLIKQQSLSSTVHSQKQQMLDAQEEHEQAVQELQNSINTLKYERDALSAQLISKNDSDQGLDQKLARAQEELERGRMERESLKFKVIEAERNVEQATRVAVNAQQQAADALRQQENTQASMAALEYELEQRDVQLEAAFQDQNVLLERLERTMEECTRLELEMAELKNHHAAQVDALTKQNESYAQELKQIQTYSIQKLNSMEADLSEERMNRIAAEKALASSQDHVIRTAGELNRLHIELEDARSEINNDKKKLHAIEEEIRIASRDAKESLHREMEAFAEAERQKEACMFFKDENDRLKQKIEELQGQNSRSEESEKEAPNASIETPKKKRGRPRKSATNAKPEKNPEAEVSVVIEPPESPQKQIEEASAAAKAAEIAATEAKQRSYEIRAEAALLVETVEDRAHEAVEAAQAEVTKLKREIERLNGQA